MGAGGGAADHNGRGCVVRGSQLKVSSRSMRRIVAALGEHRGGWGIVCTRTDDRFGHAFERGEVEVRHLIDSKGRRTGVVRRFVWVK